MLDLLSVDGNLGGGVKPPRDGPAVFFEGIQRVRSSGSRLAVGAYGLNMLLGHATAPDLLQTGEFPEKLLTFLSNGG
jgi:hypothetical protein